MDPEATVNETIELLKQVRDVWEEDQNSKSRLECRRLILDIKDHIASLDMFFG